jgi:hypothetical protein
MLLGRIKEQKYQWFRLERLRRLIFLNEAPPSEENKYEY